MALSPRVPALVQPVIGLGVVVALALLAFLVAVVAVVVVGTVVGTVGLGVGLGVGSPAFGVTSPAGLLPGQRARGQSWQQRRRQPWVHRGRR